MEGFLDIEGTEICQGDEILFSMMSGRRSSSDLGRGTVMGFTHQTMKIGKITQGYSYNDKAVIYSGGCTERVLIMRGEFKTYRKTELERHDG